MHKNPGSEFVIPLVVNIHFSAVDERNNYQFNYHHYPKDNFE
jgi:hypothetical protein